MFSIQKLFGKDDRFFDLLEASASEARQSVMALNQLLSKKNASATLESFHNRKEADKKITDQINEALVTVSVTQLEREDIEAVSAALYQIPKTVEKFAERYLISQRISQGIDFSKQITLMDSATEMVVGLVKLLRVMGSGKLDEAKSINARLQRVEGEADNLVLELLRDLYSGKHDPTTVMALKDLYDLIEKIIDRCRDAGNAVTHVVLKNS